jgi:hypothetical protein
MAWRDDVTRDVATVGLTRTKSLGLAVVIRVSAHVEAKYEPTREITSREA